MSRSRPDACPMPDRILVINLGALGDFLLALGPMQAIRRHHAGAKITLLTRPAYHALAAASGLFDAIHLDPTPRLNPFAWLALRRWLLGTGFRRVYDLQTSDRTAGYFRLFWPGPWPEWSGKVAGCSHRHLYAEPNTLHTVDRQRAQLALAGIEDVPLADLGFLDAPVEHLVPNGRLALLIPGASATRPVKRWPAERYGALAQRLAAEGLTPLVIGGPDAAAAAAVITRIEPSAVDLIGRTDHGQLAALTRRATMAIGNDTGPTHLAALAGCPTLALFSADSDPERTAPRGPSVALLQRDDLADLTVDTVMEALPHSD